jgi:hypothetical protein
MAVPGSLAALVGRWSAEHKLWLAPHAPVRLSASTATVALGAGGDALLVTYTWSDEGKPAEGVLLLQHDPASGVATGAWTDSWHLRGTVMFCRGGISAESTVTVRGSYAAPPGPDWGWSIEIAPVDAQAFRLRMFNITPQNESALAVEAEFRRVE